MRLDEIYEVLRTRNRVARQLGAIAGASPELAVLHRHAASRAWPGTLTSVDPLAETGGTVLQLRKSWTRILGLR